MKPIKNMHPCKKLWNTKHKVWFRKNDDYGEDYEDNSDIEFTVEKKGNMVGLTKSYPTREHGRVTESIKARGDILQKVMELRKRGAL